MTSIELNRLTSRAALVALIIAAIPRFAAQTAPAAATAATNQEKSETLTMEAFTVTGSNIRRMDQERALPVTIMNMEDLELRGATTPAELFDTLSIGGPIVLDEGNTLGADARGDNNSINLRGLGSGNTLVLLNGRRLPPHPISQAESGVPSLSTNINNLPQAAVARVEVLRDGASAIYGADAAAGVVNAITRRSYDGFAFRAMGRALQHGGGAEWNFEVTEGRNFNGGKSNLLITADYYHRNMLMARQRAFMRDADLRKTRDVPPPWDGIPVRDSAGTLVTDNDFDNKLSDDSSVYGNFIRGTFDASGTFVGARPTGNRGIITTSGSINMTTATAGVFYPIPLVDGTVGFRQTLPSHNLSDFTHHWFYNHNEHRIVLPKSDRFNLTTLLRHQLTESTELFGELLVYRARSVTGRSPTSVESASDHNIFVGADNPFNPFGSRFYHINGTPNADGTPRITGAPSEVLIAPSTGVIPSDFRPRRIIVDGEAFRVVGGLRGKVSRDWDWESAVSVAQNKTHDREQNAVRESRLRSALTASDPARAFNPFGYTYKLAPQPGNTTNPFILQVDRPYTNRTEVTEGLYDTFHREGRTQLAGWDLRFSGSVYDRFWGGPIGLAVGGEFRWESYKDYRPDYHGLNPAEAPFNGNLLDPRNLFFGPNENDFIALSPNVNLYAARTIASAYTELMLPFISKRNEKPFARALELTLAGRAERFSDFGGTAKPKVSVLYRATNWLGMRASAAGSFRAPNLVQTNPTPLQRAVDGVSDPYRADVTDLNVDSTATRTVLRQGNAGLQPESSKSVAAGLVFSPPRYRDFTFTVDYWRIELRDVIDDVTASAQLIRDEELLDGAVQRALAAGTPIAQVDLGSGTSNYAGNPQVRRAALTPDDRTRFANYNATRPASQQRAPVGSVVSVVTDYVNLAGREAAGLDFGFEWRLPRTRFGNGAISGDGAYLLQFDTQAEPNAVPVPNVNRDGRTRFRGNIGATWRFNRWTAGWFTYYYGPYADTGTATTEQVYEALGRPDYITTYVDTGGVRRFRYRVSGFTTHNAYVNYTIPRLRERRLLSNLSVRFGVTNVFDIEPPLADETFGYRRGAGTTARGRAYSAQVTKRF